MPPGSSSLRGHLDAPEVIGVWMPSGRLKPIDPRIIQGFTKGSEAYVRARPGYPAEALRFVTRTFDLGPGRTIVEIGAGTGKWTRQLVKTGARVIAVEPLAAMRRQLRTVVPGVRIVARRGEDTGLPAGCADLVTVAQAMHWLDGPRALAEFHRLLRPGGGVAVVYNWRKPGGRFASEIAALRAAYRPRRNWEYGEIPAREVFRGNPYFGRLRKFHFENSQLLDREGMFDRSLSVSFVAALPPARKARFVRTLGEILDRETRRTGRRRYEIRYDGEILWTRTKARAR